MNGGLGPVERDSRGILSPGLLRQRVRLTRYPPGPALAGLIDRFRAVRRDLPATAWRPSVAGGVLLHGLFEG